MADNRLYDVALWWDERLREGCQLKHKDQFVTKYDYKGSGPWYNKVATAALYCDFSLDRTSSLPPLAFYLAFHKVAGPFKRTYLSSPITINTFTFRPSRYYFVFPATLIDYATPQRLYCIREILQTNINSSPDNPIKDLYNARQE